MSLYFLRKMATNDYKLLYKNQSYLSDLWLFIFSEKDYKRLQNDFVVVF